MSWLALAPWAAAQTFQINGQSSDQQKPSQTQKKGRGRSASPGARAGAPSGGASMACLSGGVGWGGSLEVGRYARAAQEALKKGQYAQAVGYAQHLTEAAPGNACNWFLLGYTSRLAGQYQSSLSAFQRGLQQSPNSIDGLSGMAQTYMRMGKADDAKKVLLQVIAANPRRPIDLSMAGELFMQSGDLQQATNYLERSEGLRPDAHTELLLAISYMKANQTGKAKQLLDRAIKRSPRNSDIFRAVAQYYRVAHDYKSAIEILKRAPRKNADVYSELGFTYGLAGMKKESADTYEKAAGLAPKSVAVQLSAAQSQMRMGNFDKTRTYLARAEQLNAGHYRLHALRGDLATAEHRDLDAAHEYLASLGAMPASPAEGALYPAQVRLDLIEAYRSVGDENSVQQQLRIAQQQLATIQPADPDRVEYLRLRASFRALGNDPGGAEADLKQALQIDPQNDNVTLQYGNLLWKTGRKNEARQMYAGLLTRDANNRYALEALGYLSRDEGNTQAAEMYFMRMAKAYPGDYVPHLALGDLYTSMKQYEKADASYMTAHKLAPTNSLILAAAANESIEARKVDRAGQWLAMATGTMKNDPRVMRESERYLFLKGNYAESVRLGQQVIQKLPHDRDAAVYLGYGLYNLGRYDQVLALVTRYEDSMPREPNFPLLAGHVHRQNSLLQQAIDDFSRALEKDPNLFEAYVNRGYVRNDMQDAPGAVKDFQAALKVRPDSGIAHLGLAFSDLQMHHSHDALTEADLAQKQVQESGATHLVRATAYRQMRVFGKAEQEYRAALKFSPDDLKLHMALADTLYHWRRYTQAIGELEAALSLSPGDPLIFANLAAAHAELHHRDQTFRYIQEAEREAPDESAIYLATGQALLTLGDRDAANDRFTKALNAPDANRVDVRMAFAKLFVHDHKFDAARQEIALAFAESRIGEASPISTDNVVTAANVFLAIHDFDLAQRYYEKAREMGAADDTVAVGLADTFIVQGFDRQAAAELSALAKTSDPADFEQNYDYQLALANVYHQQHDNVRAITAFARANQLGAEDQVAQRGLLQTTGEEGTPILPGLNMQNDADTSAVFDDLTIYTMDTKLFGAPVTPRSSQQTILGSTFHWHPGHLPPIAGYFGERNVRGATSIPSELLIINRNTYDTLFNVATTPVFHVGNARFELTPGVGFTIRRDMDSPLQMNQNLFRQSLYVNTSPLFNWVVVHGAAIHESGPFNLRQLNSRDLGASVDFQVGHPWGSTFFVTGYSVRDLLFRPAIREFFSTASWAGLEHKFGDKLTVTGLARYIRSWRVQDFDFATGQAMAPGARFEFKPTDRWAFDGSFEYQRGQGFHLYDNVQSGFVVSYTRPLRRSIVDGTGQLPVDYPLRFALGIQQESFYNFTGPGGATRWRPVVSISLF